MKPSFRIAVAMLATALLTGCSYRPLKAPCSPDEGGTSLSYTDIQQPHVPGLLEASDRCGPMRPI